MNFLGLLLKYPGDRPLSDEEVGRQLKQKIRLNKAPHYQLSVIEMNSTYLESVDKWFGWKGFVTFLTLAFFCVLVIGLSMTAFEMAKPGFSAAQVSSEDRAFYIWNGVAMFVLVVLPVAIGLLWLLQKIPSPIPIIPLDSTARHALSTFFAQWHSAFGTMG